MPSVLAESGAIIFDVMDAVVVCFATASPRKFREARPVQGNIYWGSSAREKSPSVCYMGLPACCDKLSEKCAGKFVSALNRGGYDRAPPHKRKRCESRSSHLPGSGFQPLNMLPPLRPSCQVGITSGRRNLPLTSSPIQGHDPGKQILTAQVLEGVAVTDDFIDCSFDQKRGRNDHSWIRPGFRLGVGKFANDAHLDFFL